MLGIIFVVRDLVKNKLDKNFLLNLYCRGWGEVRYIINKMCNFFGVKNNVRCGCVARGFYFKLED